jgi:hypothetical protein
LPLYTCNHACMDVASFFFRFAPIAVLKGRDGH